MTVSGVSFGSVVAVSGKLNNMRKFDSVMKNNCQYKTGNIMQKDVTSHYQNASSTGLMAQSAQRGEPVQIFITGDDLQKVRQRKDGWDTLDGILSQLTTFIRIDNVKPEVAVQKLVSII